MSSVKEENERTPFSKYRKGYLDGYDCHDMELPGDKDYVLGYNAGAEDDILGNPNKFLDKED